MTRIILEKGVDIIEGALCVGEFVLNRIGHELRKLSGEEDHYCALDDNYLPGAEKDCPHCHPGPYD